MKRALMIVVAIAALAAGCGDDDTGDVPVSTGPYAVANLRIVYEHPDVGTITYQVSCEGDTATIVGDIGGIDAAEACTALKDPAVRQRLVDGPPADQACTEIYGGPETAVISGSVEGEQVETMVDRANGCGIDDWDNLLSTMLPAPRPFA